MFKVTVIGLGNPLLRDEGLGVKVVEKLKEIPLPDEVKIVEAGTYWLEDEEILKAEKIILVDAVKGGGRPGSIYRIPFQEINLKMPLPLSLQEISFIEFLHRLRRASRNKEVVLFGIEPAEIGPGDGLSEILKEKLPLLLGFIVKEVKDACHRT